MLAENRKLLAVWQGNLLFIAVARVSEFPCAGFLSLSSNREMWRARWHQYIQGVALQKKNPGLSIQHFSSNSKGYNKMPLNQSLPAGWTEVRLQLPWHLVASITLHRNYLESEDGWALQSSTLRKNTQGHPGPLVDCLSPTVGSWWSLLEGHWQKWNFHQDWVQIP